LQGATPADWQSQIRGVSGGVHGCASGKGFVGGWRIAASVDAVILKGWSAWLATRQMKALVSSAFIWVEWNEHYG